MTRIKHVLVLLLLILPIFALAPSMVAGTNEVLTNRAPAESMLPAQFVEETLRVAVYAEDNTSLPSYATGGVYTDNYANVISLLESEGFAVTALTTQDILDHKLMVADYDVFVLPDQLPKDEIVNMVKDYWLGGGGILSFESAAGYLFYAGMIHTDFDGTFMLYPTDLSGLWAYFDYDGILTNSRHPVTKSLQENTEYPFTENAVYLGGFDLVPLLGDRYIELAIYPTNSAWSSMFAIDNPDIGGKIVFIPGNCSSFETWIEPVIIDAVDWLAPRPKARVAIDYTHVPFYGIDSWDDNVSHVPRYEEFRNLAVNHSFTFDKLYPKGSAELTAADIAPFDVLVLGVQAINYTTAEMDVIKSWVENGGGLYVMSDFINPLGQVNLNELMSDWGLAISQGFTNLPTATTYDLEDHPILEFVSGLSFHGGEYLNVSGDAYPIANFSSNIAIAGAESGEGRVILAGDINFIQTDYIDESSNTQFSINLLNWISAGPAKVLVYADTGYSANDPNLVPLNGPVAQALNDLGISFYLTMDDYYFNMSLFRDSWDMVVFDNIAYGTESCQPHLVDFVAGGGKLIFSTYDNFGTDLAYFGVEETSEFGYEPTIEVWEHTHPIFNLPAAYGETTINSSLDLSFGTYALNLSTYANATALAGYPDTGGAAITLGVDGNVIVNGPLITTYSEDTDNSTYSDNLEIWENEIAFLYFDRPTIDSPDDVTYMETETGNEVSWTPTAGAGAWEYIFTMNGTPVESGRWYGGTLTFSVDGVTASITDCELTIFDRLGYSVSDLVVLNVTEYVATTTTTTTNTTETGAPLDPMLLIIIGAGVAVVIVIIIIVMKKKK